VAVVRHVLRVLDALEHGAVGDDLTVNTMNFLTLLRRHEMLGDLLYASPEQARGEVIDERSLVFSVGVLLFEKLTGRHPFGAQGNPHRVARIKKGELGSGVSFFPKVPAGLRNVLMGAMGPFPEDRWQSLAVLRAKLEEFARGGAPGRRLPSDPPPLPQRMRLVTQEPTQVRARPAAPSAEVARAVIAARALGTPASGSRVAHGSASGRPLADPGADLPVGHGSNDPAARARAQAELARARAEAARVAAASEATPAPILTAPPPSVAVKDDFEDDGPTQVDAPLPTARSEPIQDLAPARTAEDTADVPDLRRRKTRGVAAGLSWALAGAAAASAFILYALPGLRHSSSAPAAGSAPAPAPASIPTTISVPGAIAAAAPVPEPVPVPDPAPAPAASTPSGAFDPMIGGQRAIEVARSCLARRSAHHTSFAVGLLYTAGGLARKAYFPTESPLEPGERGCFARTVVGVSAGGPAGKSVVVEYRLKVGAEIGEVTFRLPKD